jgi:hypothetical protein
VSESDLFKLEQTTPFFRALPRLPESDTLKQEQTSAIPAPRRLSSLGLETYTSVDGLADVALASFSEVERVSEEKTSGQSKTISPIQRRWPFLAANLLLLAGILSACRRRRKPTVIAGRRHHILMKPNEFVQLLKTTIQKR